VLSALLAAALIAPAPQAEVSAYTYIHCLNSGGTRYVRRRRPTRCAHFGRGGTFGGGVNLKDIVWSSYTGRQARGTAIEQGFHLPYSNIPVRIRAYRVRTRRGRRVYTRLRAASSYGTTLVRLATYQHRAY
jgi:hypothetical protein